MVRILLAFLICMVLCSVTYAEGWEFSALTDVGSSMAEIRLGHAYGKDWTVGGLATYFAEDASEPRKEWGLGGYAKLVVDPNASFPVANWLPRLGDWLQLPESMVAETYLIGKGQMLPYDGGIDFAGSIGGGAQVGPVFMELVYDIIESGGADNPILASGLTIWAGICVEF